MYALSCAYRLNQGELSQSQGKFRVWKNQRGHPAAARRVKIWEAGQIKNFPKEVFEIYIVK